MPARAPASCRCWRPGPARPGSSRWRSTRCSPTHLRRTVIANHLEDVIEVSQQDARDFVDGEVSALTIELVETGLIDESLVEVFNGLVEAGVVTPATRCLPSDVRDLPAVRVRGPGAVRLHLRRAAARLELLRPRPGGLGAEPVHAGRRPAPGVAGIVGGAADRPRRTRPDPGARGRRDRQRPAADRHTGPARLRHLHRLPHPERAEDHPGHAAARGRPRSRSVTPWAAATRPSPAGRRPERRSGYAALMVVLPPSGVAAKNTPSLHWPLRSPGLRSWANR